jgi:simple sugar transport system permease protein
MLLLMLPPSEPALNLAGLTSYLVASLRLSVPIAYAALGGLLCERSGVLNIGLEGMLLTGAFTGAATAYYTNNVALATLAALGSGSLVGLLHAYLCVSLRVNQLVSGLAINLAASGLTAFFSRLVFVEGTARELPAIPTWPIPLLQDLPVIGPLCFQQDPLLYLLIALIPLTTYLLFRTSVGLTLRAVGEYPRAADTAGIRVGWVRYLSVMMGGALTSLGGVYLALVHVRFFTEDMSAGKGFIALAALIFGKWQPLQTVMAALLFGATDALQLRIQTFGLDIPYQFLLMLPYLVALLALIGWVGRSAPPAALGQPYSKESR